jgi:hypothetical protein
MMYVSGPSFEPEPVELVTTFYEITDLRTMEPVLLPSAGTEMSALPSSCQWNIADWYRRID